MVNDSDRPMSSSSRILAQQLAKGLETTSNLLHSLQTDVHASAVTLAGVKTEVQSMRSEVDALSKIIRDGNGERSMLARLLILERNLDSIQKWITINEENQKKQEEERKNLGQINTSGKWQLRIAILTSMIALIGTIVSAILNYLGG